MSRRISLPGADELFRKTTLSAVPTQDETTAEVAPTNRATAAAQVKKLVCVTRHDVDLTNSIAPLLVAKSMMKKLRFTFRRKSF